MLQNSMLAVYHHLTLSNLALPQRIIFFIKINENAFLQKFSDICFASVYEGCYD